MINKSQRQFRKNCNRGMALNWAHTEYLKNPHPYLSLKNYLLLKVPELIKVLERVHSELDGVSDE